MDGISSDGNFFRLLFWCLLTVLAYLIVAFDTGFDSFVVFGVWVGLGWIVIRRSFG